MNHFIDVFIQSKGGKGTHRNVRLWKRKLVLANKLLYEFQRWVKTDL